jgi:hypothetical protein
MPKREYPLRFVCSHDGCKESVTYRYSTRRDLSESYELKHYNGGRWKCMHHRNPERVLSESNRQTRFETTSDQRGYGRFFGSSGVVIGPGFLADASMLPAGTKLIVTARIELPATAQPEDGEKT